MGPQDRPGKGHRPVRADGATGQAGRRGGGPVRVDGVSGQAREGTPACEG